MAAVAAVDLGSLLDVIAASLAAGVGVTALFSVAVAGIVRFADLRGDARRLGAWLFGVLGMLALVACVAAVLAGIVVMTSGS